MQVRLPPVYKMHFELHFSTHMDRRNIWAVMHFAFWKTLHCFECLCNASRGQILLRNKRY